MTVRAERTAATRERILRAAIELAMSQRYDEMTLQDIAQAAEVSHQTVLNHFGSKEGVALAAAEVFRAETVEARARARPGDVPNAVHVLVGEYERIGDAGASWAMSADQFGDLASLLDEARATHQAWLKLMFCDRLPDPPKAQQRCLYALHAATDVYTWKLLRRDFRLDRAETEAIIVDMVEAVLTRGSDDQ